MIMYTCIKVNDSASNKNIALTQGAYVDLNSPQQEVLVLKTLYQFAIDIMKKHKIKFQDIKEHKAQYCYKLLSVSIEVLKKRKLAVDINYNFL